MNDVEQFNVQSSKNNNFSFIGVETNKINDFKFSGHNNTKNTPYH